MRIQIILFMEYMMAIYSEGTVAHLRGDLTHSGVTHNIINSLAASLEMIAIGGNKYFRIDCAGICSADISGLQLLYVWMQCSRFRGVEPELVNLPYNLSQTMQRLGFGNCFTGNSEHPETLALFPDGQRTLAGRNIQNN
jgi:ABC-type transporter Mla MlaB component